MKSGWTVGTPSPPVFASRVFETSRIMRIAAITTRKDNAFAGVGPPDTELRDDDAAERRAR